MHQHWKHININDRVISYTSCKWRICLFKKLHLTALLVASRKAPTYVHFTGSRAPKSVAESTTRKIVRGKAHPSISLDSHHMPLALQHNADAATSTTRHHNKHKRFVRTQLARTLSPLCTHSSRAPMSRATLALPVAGDRQPSASPAGPHQLSRNF